VSEIMAQLTSSPYCRLCLANRPLCNSHVIPEWVYQPLYDSIHRYRVVGSKPGKQPTFRQQGVREPLLCQGCETRLSDFEGYARGVLLGGRHLSVELRNGGVDVVGLDYQKFKLFELSILWRAGIAQGEFFSKVDLGEHGEPLRKMLLASNPGLEAQYGCALVPVLVEGELLADLIVQPETIVANGFSMAQFVFGGHVWLYVLDSGYSFPFSTMFLSELGTLPLRTAGRAVEGFVRQLAVSLSRANE
jgi:hypothetical protein